MTDMGSTVPRSEREAKLVKQTSPTLLVALVLLVIVVIGAPMAIASHYASQYFIFSPGTAPIITASRACKPDQGELALPNGAPCVRIVAPTGKVHGVEGKLLMVDVEVSQASPWQWAEYELGVLGNHHQLVPAAEYTGLTPASELGCQDTQEMVSANEDAAITAFEHLHFRVGEVPLGAEVVGVLAGSPAWDAGVKCNDLLTSLDGRPVADAAELSDRLKAIAPGTTVDLTDHPASGGPAKLLKVRLTGTTARLHAEGFTNRAYLGVELATRLRPELPFAVSIDAGNIGGPSAGLAFTLAILDALSNGRLTGSNTVAATGTIATNGDVGPVGGVREKTVAVERAGAKVFFVPNAEYTTAKDVAGKGLQVVPVTTLEQVLEILRQRYGGDLSGLKI